MDDDDQRMHAAWLQAKETAHPHMRIDCDGRMIMWGEYGKYSEYGWQIDHAMPTVLGVAVITPTFVLDIGGVIHWRAAS